MADTSDLGSDAARCKGSSPFTPTPVIIAPYSRLCFHECLAQLGEHFLDVEGVMGSSPLALTEKEAG